MTRFVQIIEFRTSRIEEIEALGRPSRTEERTAPTFRRIQATADRDNPGTYLTIVEFESYESAMENSNRPETSEFAAKMAGWLADGTVRYDETVVDGLENAPRAFMDLLDGANTGKMLVRL